MSYSKTFTGIKRVTLPYTYPEKQGGGSSSVTEDISISWTVTVDTDPFDESVLITESQVDQLAESVQIAGDAEATAIISNAKLVSSTIVGGFFSYIRSDLSQQVSELRPKVESKMMQLIKLNEACRGKIVQMRNDFSRIAERYTKIFDTLDAETRNRIYVLNGKCFSLEKLIKTMIDKSFSDSLFSQSTLSNFEVESLTAQLFGMRVKGGAKMIIDRTKNLLQSDKILSRKINTILSTGQSHITKSYYLPVISIENNRDNGSSNSKLYYSEQFTGFSSQNFKTEVSKLVQNGTTRFSKVDKNELSKIGDYIKDEITIKSKEADAHTDRVLEKTWQLWKENFTSLAK
jgi:hypothetical protein